MENLVTVKWVGKKKKKDGTGEYDATTLVDAKGKESTFGIFQDKNFYVEGAVLKVQIEKNEKDFWNITGVERVKEILKEDALREVQEQATEIAPQEKGMWWKEVGKLIVADKLVDVFGEKDAPLIKRAYKLQAIVSLEITAKKEEGN